MWQADLSGNTLINHCRHSINKLILNEGANLMADAIPNPVTELIPSVKGGLSGIASANAPFIYIDEFSNHGQYNGTVHITCEALRFINVNDTATNDRVVVAHLRMNLHALAALKDVVAKLEASLERTGQKIPVLGP